MRRSLLARARPPTSCHSLVNRLTSLASPLPLCYMFVFFFIRDCLRVVRIRRPHRRLLLDATQRDLLPPPVQGLRPLGAATSSWFQGPPLRPAGQGRIRHLTAPSRLSKGRPWLFKVRSAVAVQFSFSSPFQPLR